MSLAEDYAENGYAIVRGVFPPGAVAELAAAVDEVHAEGVGLGRSFRYGNLNYRLDGGEVRMVQWPSYHNIVLDRFRTAARIEATLRPLIGEDVKQIINQVHWKVPGGQGDFAYHQDSRFRRPDSAYRNLATSYVQTGLAIDPHDARSGAMKILPGSHKAGPIDIPTGQSVMHSRVEESALVAAGLDPSALIDLELEPGDLALWSPYLVHGSGRNASDHYRRFYINGYVRAEDCDRGEWAFRRGQPQPLGPRPNLVHYEGLYDKPGPHFT
ncbi:phytanoyl-CoA dioxygenase family protein [Parablastomonas sp. CN1-191]|uniref:phytanoyl-CoA dioxygenase family protein n=1 Tax=Parablastomonas sp. CN1-191 TaxID=3400908 RepID=UPI003BF85727